MPKDNKNEPQVRRGMTDFEANEEGFPQGLRHCISEIREKHPNIQHIGVWHALVSLLYSSPTVFMLTVDKMGYWGGISPTGKIAKEYKTRQVRKKDGPMGGTMTVVDADDVQRFYEDFYRYLGLIPRGPALAFFWSYNALIHASDSSKTRVSILSRQIVNFFSTNSIMLKIGKG